MKHESARTEGKDYVRSGFDRSRKEPNAKGHQSALLSDERRGTAAADQDFVAENGRVPERKDLIYDVVIKQRFGPWGRAMERAGVRPVAQKYLEKKDGAPKGSS